MQNQSTQNPAASLSRLGTFVMAPIGLLLLALTVLVVWDTTAWLKRTVEAQGTVIEMLRTSDKDGGVLHEPVVRFETAEGRKIRFEAGFRSNPPAYRVGDTVAVVYLPDAPERAQIRGFLSLWMGPMIMAFIGIVFFGIGAAMIAAGRSVSRALAQPAAAA
jgi:hypothetical protein